MLERMIVDGNCIIGKGEGENVVVESLAKDYVRIDESGEDAEPWVKIRGYRVKVGK